MKDPEKLRVLADWFDKYDSAQSNPLAIGEVQFDLRRIADNLEKKEPEPTPKKYVYFVSYVYLGGTAMIQIFRDRPIDNYLDLLDIKLRLEKEGLTSVVILNYQLLRTE